MSGVVVGRRQYALPDTALEFAAREAHLHDVQLTLAHVWDIDIDIDVTVDTKSVGTDTCASAHASPGPVAAALFAHRPEMFVLSAKRRPAGCPGCCTAVCAMRRVPSWWCPRDR